MGLWDFIAIAVVSGCLLEAYRVYARSKCSKPAAHAEIEALGRRVAALEKRIEDDLEARTRALETVVADADFRLGKDIEALRT